MNLYKVTIYDRMNEREKILYISADSLDKVEKASQGEWQGAIANKMLLKSIEYIGHVIIA